MRLKICDSHFTCKVANKCLNVRERMEVVEWNKRWSPLSYESSMSLKENPDSNKKLHENNAELLIKKILYTVSSFIKGTAPQI